jgi:proline iminopeptidase
MPYFKHKFGRSHYSQKGQERPGTPIICVHGGPGGSELVISHHFKMKTHRPIFAYTQLGGYLSTTPPKRTGRCLAMLLS